MIVLFDYDSLLYQAVYRIVSITDIKLLLLNMGYQRNGDPQEKLIKNKINLYSSIDEVRAWLSEGLTRNQIIKNLARNMILFEMVGRAESQTLSVLEDIEKSGATVDSVEYFLTTCKKSIRKQISTEYKAKRKGNKWVGKLRNKMIVSYDCEHSDTWEADDLIADRAKEIGVGKYIICSIDKDMKQIEGHHFNYQFQYERLPDGKYAFDEYGKKIRDGRKGLSYTSKEDSICFLATQMIMGDSGDGVKGIPGVGKVGAKKIIGDCTNQFGIIKRIVTAYRTYETKAKEKEIEFDARLEIMKNYRLLRLGTN